MKINIIELTCRLANERIEELAQDENSYDELYLESEAQIKYTEFGQEKFNYYYDYYKNVIEECSIQEIADDVEKLAEIEYPIFDGDLAKKLTSSQRERMYSEEDLREALFSALNIDRTNCCTTRTTDSIVRESIQSLKQPKKD